MYVLAATEATEAAAEAAESAGMVVPITTGGTGVVLVLSMTASKLVATSLHALQRDAMALSFLVVSESVSLIQRCLVDRMLVCDVEYVDLVYPEIDELLKWLSWTENLKTYKI